MLAACNGVIVFDNDNTVIVRTANNNYGFPKGKREKRETEIDAAFRELVQETGITKDQILIAENVWIDEHKANGNVNIRYLVAKYKTSKSNHKFVFDPEELEEVRWYSLEEAFNVLWKSRTEVLKKALVVVNDKTVKFISPSDLPAKKTILDDKLVRLSKALSWVLRHKASEIGLSISSDGYVLVKDLLALPKFKDVKYDDIKYVVDNNDKKRFSLKEQNGKYYIRANQGHSGAMASVVETDKLLTKIEVPQPICVHGTTREAWSKIKKHGLNKMKRMHIHFAVGLAHDDEVISGYRKNSEVLIYIDMEKAMNDGIEFYMSDNRVILTEGVNGVLDPKYFKEVTTNHT